MTTTPGAETVIEDLRETIGTALSVFDDDVRIRTLQGSERGAVLHLDADPAPSPFDVNRAIADAAGAHGWTVATRGGGLFDPWFLLKPAIEIAPVVEQ